MNKRILLWLILLIGVLIVIILFTRGQPTEDTTIGQPDDPPSIEEPVEEMRVLASGSNSTIDSKEVKVFNDYDEYINFIDSNFIVAETTVDFRERVVVAVFMGLRPTGGYQVDIREVEERDGKMYVYAYFRTPGEDCIVTQQITYPYEIVSIPHTNLPIEVVTEVEVYDCP